MSAVEWSYLSDALTAEQALELLHRRRAGIEEREADLRAHGLPAYTTSAGWLGYDDEQIARIAEALAPIVVATGENAHNRVMFKQLLQAGGVGVVQADACRVAGVNEVLAVLLLAAAFDKPVCPHAGGVGLCEYVQHLAAFDYLCLAGTQEGRVVDYVEHLHEHFVHPVTVADGRYRTPLAPGYSVELRPESVSRYRFPDGIA